MKKQDLINRITELYDEQNVDGSIPMLKERFLQMNDKDQLIITYRYGRTRDHISQLTKHKLAAIIYELGNDDDRYKVVGEISMQNYTYIKNKLNLK